MRDFNTKQIDKILNVVFPLPECFGCLGVPGEDAVLADEDIAWAIAEVDPLAEVKCGASKMVIISPNLGNLVIKIPFNGIYEFEGDDYDYDTDTSLYDINNYYWRDFEYADTPEAPTDYCLVEYNRYKTLKAKGLDCFVAKTWLYKTIDGCRIYLQEVVTPVAALDRSSVKTPSHDSLGKARTLVTQNHCRVDVQWMANCIDIYGETKVSRLLEFCEKINLFEDAHSGNYGYRPNNTPCLLDFSGYWG